MGLTIGVDSPLADDVRALLAAHLEFTRGQTPAEYSFAMNVEQLTGPGVTFFSAREAGRLVGVAALKHLDSEHAEVKSMHTARAERGRGVGRALVEHLVLVAKGEGYRGLSLETGTTEEFRPARTLYQRMGFVPCEAFADYRASPHNTFMTPLVDRPDGAGSGDPADALRAVCPADRPSGSRPSRP